MILFRQFNVFAESRGDGLHPKLRALVERAAASLARPDAATTDPELRRVWSQI
jgi:hypothetical protein